MIARAHSITPPNSGHIHAEIRRGEAMEQGSLGWHDYPLPISPEGDAATYDRGCARIAFTSGVGQAGRIRAFGDLKRDNVNLHCTVRTPIKLHKRGHVSQMCTGIRHTSRNWAFFKADREAACKQLALWPARQRLEMVSHRNPQTSEWAVFHLCALLFGTVAKVLRYNFPSRIIPTLFNPIFGILLVG